MGEKNEILNCNINFKRYLYCIILIFYRFSMTKVKAYATQSSTSPLAPFEIERRDILANDVEFDILYCGVCHSDIHNVRNEW